MQITNLKQSQEELDIVTPIRISGADDVIRVQANDRVRITNDTNRICSFSSVASYALEYAECPINAVLHAIEHGHSLHWLNPECHIVDGTKPNLEGVKNVRYGQKVLFEGRLFVIDKSPHSDVPKLLRVIDFSKKEKNK